MEDTEQKKSTKFKDWVIFLSYAGLATACFYSEAQWGGLMFGAIAIYAFPNTKFRAWLDKKIRVGLELVKRLLWLGLGLLIIAGVIWFFSSVFNRIGGLGKYEGQTAEEWYNEYDEASGHIEELRTALQEANDNIESANYSIVEVQESNTFDEMRDAIEDLDTIDMVDEP